MAEKQTDTEKIHEIHSKLLVILKHIHDCCTENGISYSLHGGTLLGAIREGGFIPWDDDADITMRRNDFEKFIMVINSNPEKYRLKHIQYNQVTQIMLTDIEDAWVDLFIYDYISSNAFFQKLKICLLVFLTVCVKPKGTRTIRKAVNKHSLPVKAMYNLVFWIANLFPMRWRRNLRDHVSRYWFCGNRKLIHKSNDQLIGVKEIFDKGIMKGYQLVKFEDTELMVTRCYETVLRTSYGDDYMTPIKATIEEIETHKKARGYLMEMNR